MTQNVAQRLWQPLALAGVLVFVYATVLAKLWQDWWQDPNYSHGLLMPFVMAYILWDARERWHTTQKTPSVRVGGGLVFLALLFLWLGTAGAEIYLQRLSLLLMLAGIVVYFWGARLLQWVALPLFLLWLALPLPAVIFNQIAFPLQLFASQCAVGAMQALRIPVLRQGNIIELLPRGAEVTKRLEVAEACSGIRSLMALVMLATMLAYLTQPKARGDGGWRATLTGFGFWRSLFLIAAAVPIAIVTNALRVSGTGLLAHYYGTRVAEGFFHSFSGWAVYLAAFGLLFVTMWLFDRVVQTIGFRFSEAGFRDIPKPAPVKSEI